MKCFGNNPGDRVLSSWTFSCWGVEEERVAEVQARRDKAVNQKHRFCGEGGRLEDVGR